MTSTTFSLNRVNYSIGAAPLFHDLSMSFSFGTLVGIIGANGVGKSTLLRMMAGISKPSTGQINFGDIDIYQNPTAFKAQLGYVSAEHFLYPHLTVAENLQWLSRLRRPFSENMLSWTSVLAQYNLLGYQKVLYGKLSDGLKKRVELAATLLHQPSLLIVDEPCAQLDPEQRQYLWANLCQLRSPNRLIVFSSHHNQEILPICNEIYAIQQGKLTPYVHSSQPAKPKDKVLHEMA